MGHRLLQDSPVGLCAVFPPARGGQNSAAESFHAIDEYEVGKFSYVETLLLQSAETGYNVKV